MTARLCAFAGCVLLLAAPPVSGHEIGTTQLAAWFPDDQTYRIEITVDPDALLTRLELLDGRPVTPPADRQGRDRRIASLTDACLKAVRVAFDGAAVRPQITYRPASALNDLAQGPSIVQLTGVRPAGAGAFSVRYDLAIGTFALVAHVGAAPAQTIWIEAGAESAPVSLVAPPPPLTTGEVAARYAAFGFTHILPKGLDHILFVLGLFLLTAKWRPVLTQISAFTLAHSITLGLTMYGVVSLPAQMVEPMIALSIAYVAIENLLTTELKSWRVALVFSFGLLHGMGFAGVLKDVGLPRHDFLTALIAFNVGVEAGQLAVVGIAFAAVAYWRRNAVTYRRFVTQPASVVIGMAGVYWMVVRLL
jgi:hydrogenase/urease accessory protein HupE